MSKPLTWDKSKDDKRRKRPDGSGSSKMRSGSFPTKAQREQKKKADAFKKTAESIWKQGKGGS